MIQRRTLVQSIAALSVAPALVLAQSAADSYPAKAVSIVVPFAPGQSGDILARVLADELTKLWGKPVIVENKGGSGGTVGSKYAAGAPADGYTLLLGSSGPMSIAPNLYKNTGYDSRKDFTPIMNVAGVAQLLVVSSDSKYLTLKDLVAAAKANPGKLSYGSGGAGSTQHLTMEMFKQRAGIHMLHIPYRGSGPAYTDMFGGQIDALFDSQPGVLPFIQSGRARVLAVSTPQRAPALANVPTVAESGYPGFDVLGWLGVVAPKGLDPAIRNKINVDLKKILASDSVKARFASLGMVAVGSSPDDFGTYIDAELKKWGGVIKTGNITVE